MFHTHFWRDVFLRDVTNPDMSNVPVFQVLAAGRVGPKGMPQASKPLPQASKEPPSSPSDRGAPPSRVCAGRGYVCFRFILVYSRLF